MMGTHDYETYSFFKGTPGKLGVLYDMYSESNPQSMSNTRNGLLVNYEDQEVTPGYLGVFRKGLQVYREFSERVPWL
jgi:hypothetical protein